MNCPNCGLINPESAAWCDCGYDFVSGRVHAIVDSAVPIAIDPPVRSDNWRRRPRSGWWKLGMSVVAVLALIGALAVALLVVVMVSFPSQGMRGRPDLDALARWFRSVLVVLVLIFAGAVLFILSRPSAAAIRRHRRPHSSSWMPRPASVARR
jgi:hypothetical protein